MRFTLATTFALLAPCLAGVALAQSGPPGLRPYAPVSFTRPAPPTDPGLAAFRSALAAAARSRRYGDLEALVQPQGFFWNRDFDGGYDPRRSATDNLAAAIGLERRDGAGWASLGMLASEPTVEPLQSRPGVVCAPARPLYDSIEFSNLLERTRSGAVDWAYPRADATTVPTMPQGGAPVAGRLGLQFVRLLGFEAMDAEPARWRSQWARLALPDGQTGYAAPGRLMSVTAERLCYMRDLVGGWRIAGFVAGEN